MRSKPRKPALSIEIEALVDERLPFPLARKVKHGMFSAAELERLLDGEGADMAEIQSVLDEYRKRYKE